jgi:MarR family transcriptional regulator, organic hydroperoxide resistance regulator
VTDRRDLGASLHRLTREVLRREQPILESHGLQMWEYSALTALDVGAAPTQAQLAARIGRDATRLIPLLDRLQGLGLVERTPDARDRRNRVVTLTAEGRHRLHACRAAIRAMEEDLLADVPRGHRETFRAVLERLAPD